MELAQNICTLADQAYMEWREKRTCTLYVRPRKGWDECSITFTPLERHILIMAEGLEYKVLRSDVQQFDDLLGFLIEAGVDGQLHRFATEEYYSDCVDIRLHEYPPSPCGFRIKNGTGQECYEQHCSEEAVIQQALKMQRISGG
jgi:hypothetical protein